MDWFLRRARGVWLKIRAAQLTTEAKSARQIDAVESSESPLAEKVRNLLNL
jgi:hypothetical protein